MIYFKEFYWLTEHSSESIHNGLKKSWIEFNLFESVLICTSEQVNRSHDKEIVPNRTILLILCSFNCSLFRTNNNKIKFKCYLFTWHEFDMKYNKYDIYFIQCKFYLSGEIVIKDSILFHNATLLKQCMVVKVNGLCRLNLKLENKYFNCTNF